MCKYDYYLKGGVYNVRNVYNKTGCQKPVKRLWTSSLEEKAIKKDVPVKWIVEGKTITTCNNEIKIESLGVKMELKEGENVIYFTSKEEGNLVYTCWMDMCTDSFTVEEASK